MTTATTEKMNRWRRWDSVFARLGRQLSYDCVPHTYPDGGKGIEIRVLAAGPKDIGWAEIHVDNALLDAARGFSCSFWQMEIEPYLFMLWEICRKNK